MHHAFKNAPQWFHIPNDTFQLTEALGWSEDIFHLMQISNRQGQRPPEG